eukprot:1187460-Ditylum_brightwellii.AAC.2
MCKELHTRFNDQAETIGNLDEKIKSQAGKLDSLLVSMASITKNVATDQDIKNMAANNNVLMEQVNTLCATIENIERMNNIPNPHSSTKLTKKTAKGSTKARPN